MTIYTGDCVDVMAAMDAASFDAIVTDPPYGLEFMGKEWDRLGANAPGYAERPRMTDDHMGKGFRSLPNYYMAGKQSQDWHHRWATEALRVAKPGAHLLAFGGTRTYHRLTCALEDAGWEIRDCLVWAYASGFPKSLDVSKAIDKAAGAEREVTGSDGRKAASSWLGTQDGETSTWGRGEWDRTDAPATDAAKRWQGWGTALKPAWEPIVLARKPLQGTVAANVQRYGTGALNIDASRIGTTKDVPASPSQMEDVRTHGKYGPTPTDTEGWNPLSGRWPPNLLLTDAELFDVRNDGVVGSGASVDGFTGRGPNAKAWLINADATFNARGGEQGYGDTGGYARFFLIPQRYNGTCPNCGRAISADNPSYRLRPSADSAPDGAPTSPVGPLASTDVETEAPTTSATVSGFWPSGNEPTPSTPKGSQRDSSPNGISRLLPASGADQSGTSSDTTTTTRSRWLCASCVDDATALSTLGENPVGTVDSPAARGTYPKFLLVPKASRSDREPVWGEELAEAQFGGEGHALRGERNGVSRDNRARRNTHPTTKPVDLMRHLVRLVTPPGGRILDPFLGSGTTAIAAIMEGFKCVGIEREPEYVAIAEARLNGVQQGIGL